MADILNLPCFYLPTQSSSSASLSSLSSLDERSFSASTVIEFNDKDDRKKTQFSFSSSPSSDPSPFYLKNELYVQS